MNDKQQSQQQSQQQQSATKKKQTEVTIGQVVNGYEYIGGDPKNQQSWKKVK